jgi:NAD-dependent SIR2 family protein deacetylase
VKQKFASSKLVHMTAHHYTWKCLGCYHRLQLRFGDVRLGSGQAPRCPRCGSRRAPINPDIVPMLPS